MFLGLSLAIGLTVAPWIPQSAEAAQPDATVVAGRVMTVLGPVDPGTLGKTLTHEHIFIDFTLPLDEPDRWQLANRRWPADAAGLRIWNMRVSDPADRAFLIRNAWENRDMLRLLDVDESSAEVMQFRQLGGGTIVDVTSIGIGRDPERLVEVSRRTAVHIIMGAGWYRSAWHPAGHDSRTVDSLTEEIVRDLTVGVGNTGVRAGIIGEVSAMDVITDPGDTAETRGLRAAARASRLTGAAVSLHQWYRDGRILEKTLDLFEREGGDLSRVIVGHMDGVTSQDLGKLRRLLERRVNLEFDLLGTPFRLNLPVMDERPMVDAIAALVKEGYGDRLLLSHDVCTKFQQLRYGGNGFTYIEIEVVPYLRRRGLTDAQIRQLTIDNPRRLLTLAAPAPPLADWVVAD